MDTMLLLVLGGVPWQGYFQRILSMKTTLAAQGLSVAAVFGCLIIGIPAAIIGVIGRYTGMGCFQYKYELVDPLISSRY